MTRVIAAFAMCVFCAGDVPAQSCAQMTKDLTRLRLEYHTYAGKTGGVTFDGLVAILDKIVDLKNTMRKSNCKVAPRNPPTESK